MPDPKRPPHPVDLLDALHDTVHETKPPPRAARFKRLNRKNMDPKNLNLYVVTITREVVVAAESDEGAVDYVESVSDRDFAHEKPYVRIAPLTLKNKPEGWGGACLPYGELAHSEFPLAKYAAWQELMAKRKEDEDDGG